MRSPTKPSPSFADRAALLQEQLLDVLVVGGGIVGAGVARDAAMRGLHTGLVEQHDFASGTSSRSSRLLHGGMRYLAQGRVGLVREASKEKTVLRRIAPHLAQPLEFVFPTRRASGWPRWKLGIGVKIYDWLCGVGQGGGSGSMNAAQALKRLPGLDDSRLTGAVRYHDALTNDARLVLDTINSATRHGAIACNYTRLVDAAPQQGAWRCELADLRTGTSYAVEARTIVNATGPWSDRIPHSATSLRLTKGVHLVIDRARLAVADAVVLAEGSRILFVIPWGERVILGTTDTDYHGPLDNPPCDDEDVKYILDVVNANFPKVSLSGADVISTWSGLRPLVADPNGNPSDISRRHKIAMNQPGWWDVTGGKLTTYRLMAEETVNALSKYLGAQQQACRTAVTPLLEDAGMTWISGILPPPVSAAAVSYFCREEGARHLDDVMIRRSSWRHYHRNHAEIASNVAQWMAAELHWTPGQLDDEYQRYCRLTGASQTPRPHLLAASHGSGHQNGHRAVGRLDESDVAVN